MSHTITINSVDTKDINGFTNAVCRIYYTMSYTDGTNTESHDFVHLLIDPDDAANYPDTSSFTSYDNITEAQMKGWIEGRLVFNEHLEYLKQRMRVAVTSTVSNPALPWA